MIKDNRYAMTGSFVPHIELNKVNKIEENPIKISKYSSMLIIVAPTIDAPSKIYDPPGYYVNPYATRSNLTLG